MLRGLKKVGIEWGLVCMAHNLQKLAIQCPPVFCPVLAYSVFDPFFIPFLDNPCFDCDTT
jgi:hypothetical protein